MDVNDRQAEHFSTWSGNLTDGKCRPLSDPQTGQKADRLVRFHPKLFMAVWKNSRTFQSVWL